MGSPGIALTAQVTGLLADPLGYAPARQGSLELCEVTEQVAAARRAVEVLQFRQLDEMVAREGSRKAVGITAAWLHAHSELLLRDATAAVTLAVRMCAHPEVLAAYAGGDISRREAKFVVDFLTHPPKGMPADAADDVEDALLLAGRGRDYEELRGAAEKIRDSLSNAPAPGEDLDRNTLHISPLAHGRYDLAGNVDTETGESLLAALSPFTIPRPDHNGNPDPRNAGQRNAEALAELLRRQHPGTMEKGLPPRLSVTIPVQGLFADIPTRAEAVAMIRSGRIDEVLRTAPMASTEWGNWISHETARRLACDCELAVIGVDVNGAPLNVNTGKRFASGKQRKALRVRDRGCAFPGCNRPASWTQAHHIVHWLDKHITRIDNLVALCHYHHVAVHHHGWDVALGADRFPVFRPPASLDALRRWQNSQGGYVGAPPGYEDLPAAA